MTHRGPFQPLPFCDSVILCAVHPGACGTSEKSGDESETNILIKECIVCDVGTQC